MVHYIRQGFTIWHGILTIVVVYVLISASRQSVPVALAVVLVSLITTLIDLLFGPNAHEQRLVRGFSIVVGLYVLAMLLAAFFTGGWLFATEFQFAALVSLLQVVKLVLDTHNPHVA